VNTTELTIDEQVDRIVNLALTHIR
jgi:hypothetical protein